MKYVLKYGVKLHENRNNGILKEIVKKKKKKKKKKKRW